MPLSCRKTSYTRTMRFKAFLICRPEDTQSLQVPFYLSLVWADTEPQWLTSPHLKGPFPCPLGMKYFKWSDLTNGIKTNKTNKLDSLSSLTWQKELITHLAETTNGQTIKPDSWPSLLPVGKTEPSLHHWALCTHYVLSSAVQPGLVAWFLLFLDQLWEGKDPQNKLKKS